ncbi:hypothetical protein F5Y01DRAFT_309925 [Xylaria sp. FL0043]|nr:hypothetical protein F5Y01DRAFT_309925 [Xylaria sp. FL0043]
MTEAATGTLGTSNASVHKSPETQKQTKDPSSGQVPANKDKLEVVPTNEQSTKFIQNTLNELRRKYGPQVLKEQTEEVVTGKKRKRQYVSRSKNYTDTIKSRLKSLELSCRVSFFLTLNNSQSDYLFDYFITEFTGSIDLKNWAHVRSLDSTNPNFKKTKNKTRASIDLKASGKPVEKYCKLLYVELVSFTKMHVLWLNNPNRLEASEYLRRGLAHRLSICTQAKKWAKYIPKRGDIKLVTYLQGYKRAKKEDAAFKSVDDDQELYVLNDTDEEEETPEGDESA